MDEELVKKIVIAVQKGLTKKISIEIEASGRHIHLSRRAVDELFGSGYQLTKVKELSQPGQYVCQERLTVVGPKGSLTNVVILGPERPDSQVEISLTDARLIGISVPLRESGDIVDTPGVTLLGNGNVYQLDKGLIMAKSHIHLTEVDAAHWGLRNKELVQVQVMSKRPLIFDDVLVRVSPNYATFMHIDYDEANACGHFPGLQGSIIKKSDSSG